MKESLKSGQRYIYVMLSRTHTIPAKLIRLYTGEPYSHASIALDIELNQMFSFARKHIYNPFDCGFIDEHIDTGIFGKDKHVSCSVYEIPVTEEQYQSILQEIDVFKKNRDEYKYNYTGLVGVMFGKNVEDGKHFFCSQFISYVFRKSGIWVHSKKNGLTRPYDFHLEFADKRIYQGSLSGYRQFLRLKYPGRLRYSETEWEEAI